MKQTKNKSIIITILLGLVLFSFISFTNNVFTGEEKEQEEVKKTIYEYYIEGLANNGDTGKINEGFHPGFILFGITNDKKNLWTWTIDQWKERIEKRKANGELPRTGDEKFSAKILSVDINGVLAVVKLELYKGNKLTYIDYLSLYKLDGKWKIICKTYYKIPA